LKYLVQYKTNATDVTWQNLRSDVTATNTQTTKSDSLSLGLALRLYCVKSVD